MQSNPKTTIVMYTTKRDETGNVIFSKYLPVEVLAGNVEEFLPYTYEDDDGYEVEVDYYRPERTAEHSEVPVQSFNQLIISSEPPIWDEKEDDKEEEEEEDIDFYSYLTNKITYIYP